jgi:hypothetical protein
VKKLLHQVVVMLCLFSMIGNNYALSAEKSVPTLPSVINTSSLQVLYIQKGTEAPFEGYLFPPDKALEFRKELIELDSLRSMQPSYEKSITLYQKNEDVLLTQNQKLSEALSRTEAKGVWETRMYFILGIVVTGLAVYGAGRLK